MRKLTSKPFGIISPIPSHISRKQCRIKKLLKKLEIWAEALGDWYGAIFPQEHPCLELMLASGPRRNGPLNSHSQYDHKPRMNRVVLTANISC